MFFLSRLIFRSVDSYLDDQVSSIPAGMQQGLCQMWIALQWLTLGLLGCLLLLPLPVNAQSSVPFPNASGVADGNSNIINDVAAAQEAYSRLFNGIWTDFLNTNSPFFVTLINALTYVVVIGFALWFGASVWDWQKSNFKQFPWQKMYTPLLVIFLFANNGQLTVVALQAYRSVVYRTNRIILTQTFNGVEGVELIQDANQRLELNEAIKAAWHQCFTEAGGNQELFDLCWEEARGNFQRRVGQINVSQNTVNWVNDVLLAPVNVITAPGRFVMGAISTGITRILEALLRGIASLFQIFLAYILAVWCSTAPIWIALCLFPAGQNSLKIFTSGLFAGMVAIWTYSVLQIALASQADLELGFGSSVFVIIGGLINPMVAILAASLGFSAILASTGKLLNFVRPLPSRRR